MQPSIEIKENITSDESSGKKLFLMNNCEAASCKHNNPAEYVRAKPAYRIELICR